MRKEDFHYPTMSPFTRRLDEVGAYYQLDLEDYDAHSDMAVYYPDI